MASLFLKKKKQKKSNCLSIHVLWIKLALDWRFGVSAVFLATLALFIRERVYERKRERARWSDKKRHPDGFFRKIIFIYTHTIKCIRYR